MVMINNIVLKVVMNFVFKLVRLIGARCGFKCAFGALRLY